MFFFIVPWLLLMVPWINAGMRRLHDTGRSGGWPSQPHANRYG